MFHVINFLASYYLPDNTGFFLCDNPPHSKAETNLSPLILIYYCFYGARLGISFFGDTNTQYYYYQLVAF